MLKLISNFFRTPIAFAIIFALFITGLACGAEFIFFHTSDMHGAISAHPDPSYHDSPKPMMGGFAVLKTLLDKYRNDPANADKRVLYFDAGDFFQGTPIVDRTKGAVMVDMLNRVGVDTVTIGNHEFDYSYPNLVEQLKKASFSIACCNVIEKATGKLPPFAKEYVIHTHKGKKVGVIGINTPETVKISFEKNVQEIYFTDPMKAVPPIVKKLRKAGVDYIILLSHLGFNEDLKYSAKLQGIDLILGGHSHTLHKEIYWSEPYNIPIIHSGSSCEHAGIIHLDLSDSAAPIIRLEPVPLYVKDIAEDPTIKEREEFYLKDLRKEMSKVIGESKVDLFRGLSGADSTEGSLIADAMRKYSGADIAFINFGGVRQPLFKGMITVEDAFMVQPFDNFVEILEMTGIELLDLVERAYSNDTVKVDFGDEDATMKASRLRAKGLKLVVGPDYGILLPSGLKITYDPEKPKMQRILRLETENGEEVKPEKTYKVAINDFIGAGGDGFTLLRDFPKREKLDLLVRDALIRHITEMKVIETLPEQRVFNTRLIAEYDY